MDTIRTKITQTVKTGVKINEIHVKTRIQILRYSPVSLINSITKREETFENNFDSEVTVILKISSRSNM